MQIARAQRDLMESRILQVRAGGLPQVTGTLTYNRTLASVFERFALGGLEFAEEGASPFEGLPFGQPNTWVTGVSLTQPLYAAGRVSTGLEIARDARLAADLEIEETVAEVTLQVRSAYFQAVLGEVLVGIATEAFELADAQLRQVELFQRQGTASDFDVLTARVERDNLEPAIVEARNARRLAELNLRRLAGLPSDRPLELATPLAPELGEVDERGLRAALERRAALRALEANVSARAGAVRIARSERLPTFDLVANFNWQAFPTPVFPADASWQRDWVVGVQARVPILTGGRTRGQIDEARAELRRAELQRDRARGGFEVELEAALGEYRAARAQIEARRATVGQARRGLELAELRFRSGLATQLNVSNSRLLLEQARVNEAQALFDYVAALFRLERVGGGAVPLVDAVLPRSP